MFPNRFYIALLLLTYYGCLFAQPERINYFRQGDSLQQQTATLDPGDLLLSQGILVTNQYEGSNISFQLSFDRQSWASFGLGPLYSSIFSLKNQAGCYFEITTIYGEERQIRKEYYLSRGKCYSVYWNPKESCWDMKANRCRQE